MTVREAPKRSNLASHCNALGMKKFLDLSCAKRITIGRPFTGICQPEQDISAGLCYSKCKQGYKGAGPVCWGKAPPGWVECGMGAAVDTLTCGLEVVGQVTSVAEAVTCHGSSSVPATAPSR